jgi:hypothetical protein
VDEILNIVKRVNKAILSEKSKRVALTTVLAIHKPRIFEQGLNENGNKIGTYSPKYAIKKKKIGRQSSFVNLEFTGQMKQDYGLIINGDKYAFGFQNEENDKKMGYAQERYNAGIAHLSQSEMDLLMDVLSEEQSREI